MSRIEPTIGRKLYFYPAGDPSVQRYDDQPIDATIVYVWTKTAPDAPQFLNLLITDHSGVTQVKTSVPLIQADEAEPTHGFYAKWMPFQVGQAARQLSQQALANNLTAQVAQLQSQGLAASAPVDAPAKAVEPDASGAGASEVAAAGDGVTAAQAEPRSVTLDQINSKIKGKFYFTAKQGAEQAARDNGMNAAGEPADGDALGLLTICVLRLENGFTVLGKSACADPAKFNEEIGRKIALDDAINQVWALEGYLLKQAMFEGK